MSLRLVALDEGSDIPIDRDLIMVGRHSTCDARLESLRVSRNHCCVVNRRGSLEVRDLGSTNGIRINGRRVDVGTLRPGDELTVAHIRFRLEDCGTTNDNTVMATISTAPSDDLRRPGTGDPDPSGSELKDRAKRGNQPLVRADAPEDDSPLAAAVRGVLPAELAGYKIQVIVQAPENPGALPKDHDSKIQAEEDKGPL